MTTRDARSAQRAPRWLAAVAAGLLVAGLALAAASSDPSDPATAGPADSSRSGGGATPSSDADAAAAGGGAVPDAGAGLDGPGGEDGGGVDGSAGGGADGGVPPLSALYAARDLTIANGPAARDGCPPPPPSGGDDDGGGDTPWRPAVKIAEADLPAPADRIDWNAPPDDPTAGKGMWIWQYSKTEESDYEAIVDRAVAADLDHLWVRVGDSRDGFYAARHLEVLVPLAHDHGLRVIGWGFPFLHDPLDDVAWTVDAIRWRSTDGAHALDGFSPDIETATEGVELTARRVAVYLSHVREAAGDLPIPATVYPPVDWVWESDYPYETMAPYVDAFVPMDYWMCGDPGYLVRQSLQRLAELRPVHVLGQAFSNCCAGRREAPSAEETLRFFDVAVREGAVGASLWVWQDIDDDAWDAMAAFPWHEAVASHAAHPTQPEYAAD